MKNIIGALLALTGLGGSADPTYQRNPAPRLPVDLNNTGPGRNATKRVGYKARSKPVGHRKAFKMPVKLRWALKAIGAANRSAARSGVRAPYWPDCKGL